MKNQRKIGEVYSPEGQEAEHFLEEFNAKAIEKYGVVSHIVTVLNYDPASGKLQGSNPFAVVHADSLLKPRGIRVATMADVEKSTDLIGTQKDTALVLRSRTHPNSYLASNLANQVETRRLKVRKEVPLVIQLRGLEVVRDDNSPYYGLSFRLTNESQIIEAPSLSGTGYNARFSKLDENGLPIPDSTGNRRVFARGSGLCSMFLSTTRDIYSHSEHFEYSGDKSIIALVRVK